MHRPVRPPRRIRVINIKADSLKAVGFLVIGQKSFGVPHKLNRSTERGLGRPESPPKTPPQSAHTKVNAVNSANSQTAHNRRGGDRKAPQKTPPQAARPQGQIILSVLNQQNISIVRSAKLLPYVSLVPPYRPAAA